jgi:hypothetical protein
LGGESVRPIGLKISVVVFLLAAAYNIAFPALFDPSLFPLILIGALCLVNGISLFLQRKLGLYLTLLLFPIMLLQGSYTLFAVVNSVGWDPNPQTAAFNASLIAYSLITLLAFLLVLDKRAELRPMAISLPSLGRSLSKSETVMASEHEDKPKKTIEAQ